MKKLLILLWSLSTLYANAQDPVEPYLLIASDNNPGLKASYNEYLAELEKLPQAKALPDPQLNLGVFIQPVETRVGPQQASVGITQQIPWFGTLGAQAKLVEAKAETSLVGYQDIKLKLFRDVRLAYNELYFLHEAVELTKENLSVLNSFKELARVNFESGKTGFVNVLRVEMEEQELKARLASLMDDYSAAYTNFENLLNQPLEAPPVFPDSLYILKPWWQDGNIEDSIQSGNQKLQRLNTIASVKEQQLALTALSAKPSFSLGFNYVNIGKREDMEFAGNGTDAWMFPQIGIRLPLSGKKYQAMQRQVGLEKEGIAFYIQDEINRIDSEVTELLNDYGDGERRLDLYRRLHDLADRSLSLLQTEFTTGKADFEEVLRMERKLLNYQLEAERARVDMNNAVYQINYLLGK